MMIFNDDMLSVVTLDVLAVDFCAGVFALSKRTDVEVVVQNSLNGDDCPRGFDLSVVFLPVRFLTHSLGHSRCGNSLIGKVVRYFLVSPSVAVVELEYLPHGFRFCGDDFKFLALVYNVAVRSRA